MPATDQRPTDATDPGLWSTAAAAVNAVETFRASGGNAIRRQLAGNEQLREHELADEDDTGLFGPGSTIWKVHGDPAMVIGGVRALLFQTLHPLAMAGVADHSDYRADPMGRLHRTGRFIGATTFGSTETAEQMIATINAVHTRVVGTAPDGRPYAATDPELLLWVHITEVDSFLRAYQRFGADHLNVSEQNRYIAEMAEIAVRLGVDSEAVPRTVSQLSACLKRYRAQCAYGRQAKEAVRFLLFPPLPLASRPVYAVLLGAAIGSLPRWVRFQLRLPILPGADTFALRPAAVALTRTLGWFLNEE